MRIRGIRGTSYTGDIALDDINISAELRAGDTEYPQFSDYWDDNATLVGSGTGHFNVTVTSTNGTVLLEINNTNVTATNLTTDVYNASYYFTSNGTYPYRWHSWGNGTGANYNVSATRSYTVNASDTTPPEVTINSPQNITYYSLLDFPLTLNVSLNENGSVEYTLDGGINNVTMNTTDNQNFNATLDTLDDSTYTFQVYANDTAGNRNDTESVVFTLTTENVIVDGTVKDSLGDTINSTVVILYSENSTVLYNETEEIHDETTIPITELYDIEVVPLEIDYISIIEFTEVNLSEFAGDSINLVQVDEIIDDPDFEIIHVVNPIINDFANATMTFLPGAKRLYKCQDWNFTERTCGGDWELLSNKVNITQENTVELEPNATAYGEIPITNALHLDSDREFISNIFEQVRYLDGSWSETIPSGDYIRITFRENLTSENDITIYPRTVSGTPSIEVYENNDTELIANFTSINDSQYNTVYLTSLVGSQNIFDLHVVGGSVEFDHIVDPSFTARTETYVNLASLTTPFDITVTKPTGTVDGDILFVWIAAYKTTTPTIDSVPSGWTEIAYNRPGNSYYYYWLYYKVANNEPASWTWSFSATVKVRAVCSCYTGGDFDVQSIDDIVISNTAYTTSDTNCKAASMNVPNANSPLIFWGGVYATASRTFTKPSVPTTDWVEDDDAGSTTPDFWTEVCSMIWSGSGDTGDISATISGAAITTKHAFAVALNPAAADTEYPQFSSLTETPTDPATYSYGQNYQFNATITSTNGTAGVEFNGVNYTATNSSNLFSVTISNLAANTGGYNYYWWAFGNGTSHNFNSTTTQTYTINKAIPQGSISGTSPITYGTVGDVQGSESNSGDGDVQYKLYRDGVEASNPDNSVLGAGNYNYVYNATSGTNYTANVSLDTFELTVNKALSQTSLTFDKASPQTYGTSITPTCSIITGQGSAVLTMDGNVITSGNPLTLGADTYAFNCSLAESQNYTYSENVSDFTIDKAVPTGNLQSSEGWTITYPTETTISLSESNNGDGDVTYIIYRDGTNKGTGEIITLGYGTYDYLLNTTGGTNWTANSSMDAQTLTVNKNTGACDVLFNETSPITYPAAFKVWSNCNSDFTLYRNGTTISNNSIQPLSAGTWNFTVIRTDKVNYTNIYDEELFTINQATGQVNGFINNTQANFTAEDGTDNKNIYLNATITSPCIGTGSIVVNGTAYNSGTLPLYNITNLSIGFYNATFNYDGNINCSADTEVWWINITAPPDDPPTISIVYPQNTTYNIDVTQLNYTASDDIDLSHCWYSLNGGVINSTPDATCSNFTGLSSSEGSNTWIVYANDSIGQENSDSVTFTKDTVAPTFSNYLRSPDPPNEDQNVQVNVTITETNLDKVILEFNNGTAKNYTVTTNNGNEYYFTVLQGNYTAHDSVTYYWYANDTASNLNKSAQQSFTVANQIPSVSPPTLNNTIPKTNDVISCNGGTFSDNDAEDIEQARYFKWYDTNVEISGQTSQTLSLTVAGLDKGDVIKCSVKVYDGYGNSSWTNSSNTATIQNSPPTITNPQITVSWNANGSTYNYDYEATDADNDGFTWYDNTTLFDINSATGVISDTPTESEAGSYEIRINVSDGSVNATDDFTYTINDVTSPNINFQPPTETNNSQLTRNYIQVNVTASDGKAIGTITLRLYNSTSLVQTNTSSTSPLFVNFTNLPDEFYYFNATVNDTSGNTNQTGTRTVTTDTGAPTINYVSPTENSGVYRSRNYIEVNVTASDPNLDKIVIRLYNSAHTQINSASSSTSPNLANFTALNDGLYYYNATANDTFGNKNSLSTRNITLDTIKPSITNLVEFPTDPATWTSGAIYQFNATITDTNLDKVLIEFNGINYTPTKTGNVYNLTRPSLAAGTYNYYWYANDSAGNVNTSAQTYTVNQNPEACNVLFNETSPVNYGILFSVFSDCTSGFTLKRNETTISNNSVQNLAAGTWNFTIQRTDTQNYSNIYDEELFTINKAAGNVTLLINGSAQNQTGIYGIQTNASASTLCGTVTLYRNGTDVTSQNNNYVTLAVGYYNYTAASSGDQNHSSVSITRFVNISKAQSEVNLTLNGTRGNKTITQDSSIWLNVTKITGDSGATLRLYKNGTLINQGPSPLANLTAFNVMGLFNITGIYVESQNFTGSYETWWVNVTETPDLTNPSVSGLTESPADPATYSPGQIYKFNATITDNRQLDIVLIEFNGVNYTPINLGGGIYSFNRTDLAVGTYNYRWYANDTSGNMNGTENGTYTINKATPSLSLTITPSNTVTYPTETTANGSNCPSQLACNLYKDSVSVSNSHIIILGAGTYNYTYNTTGNTNYTSASVSQNLTINKNTGACDVLFNETSPITYGTTFKVWSNCNSPFTLKRNGTTIANNSEQALAASSYNFSVQRTDTTNYSNTFDNETFIIQKATGVVHTYLNNSRSNITIEQQTAIYLNGTLETGVGAITLYRNETIINQGNSPLSNLTNFTDIGLNNITTIYSENENYTSAYETWWVKVIELDVTPPQISITYPQNTSYNSVQTQLNYTASDNFGLNSCWYSTNNGATNTTINCNDNITGLNSGQGNSTWIVWANDAKGNKNSSSVTFFVDSIIPTISFIPPTETNNASLGRNHIQVNVSASDTNLDTITIRLYNSTNLLRENTSITSPFFINYTGLTVGTYYFNATINDTLNNQNSTQTRNVSLILPTLTIIKPENETYITKNNLPLDYSANDEDYVWYNLDLTGSNTTISGNTTFNITEGQHTIYLYANNSLGATSKNVTFTINSNKFKVHYDTYKGDKKGSSTDFDISSYEDLQNLSGISLENIDYGKISFNEAINVTDDTDVSDNETDLNTYTNISLNRIEVNSTALPNFNKSATLYLYNLTFTNPRILRNNETCPSTICTKISYDATVGTLKFNVTQFTVYSAEETPVEAAPSVGPEVGVGPKTPVQCLNNTDCERGEVCWKYRCVKLFDVKIINFESPVELGSFFEFTYLIKGMARINDDVEVRFWIEKDGEKVTSGSDTIYMGSFEEKTETTKIFLPTNVKSGIYEFYVEVVHQAYQAKSHRTIEIQVKEGIATIRFREVQELKIYASIIIALLSIIIIFLIIRSLKKKQPLVQEKIIKEIPREKEQLKLYIKPKIIGYAQKKEGGGGTLRKIFEIFRNLIGILSLRISNLYQNLKKRREELRLQRQRQTYQEKPREILVEKEFSINDLLLKIKVVFLRMIYRIKLIFIRLWGALKKKGKKMDKKNKQYSRKKKEKTAEKLIQEINKNDENKKGFEKDIISDIVDKEKREGKLD